MHSCVLLSVRFTRVTGESEACTQMTILWVTATPFKIHNLLMNREVGPAQSGGWLGAALEEIRTLGYDLHIATVGNTSAANAAAAGTVTPAANAAAAAATTSAANAAAAGGAAGAQGAQDAKAGVLSALEDGVSYHVVSDWSALAATLSPDLIQIWGTESPYGLYAEKAFPGVPAVIFVQGVITQIHRHYYDALPWPFSALTPRDFHNRRWYAKQARTEKEIFERAYGVIVDNRWATAESLALNPGLKVFTAHVPIRSEFYGPDAPEGMTGIPQPSSAAPCGTTGADRPGSAAEVGWSLASMRRHTIFTNAGGYPIKGHHVLFKAVAKVKRQYPDVRVIVPGTELSAFTGLKRTTGYVLYLKRLIRRYGLQDNIVYPGVLSAAEMAGCISRCNAYVMPSMMENHSNSVIEAMMLGAPCVASPVGCIPELAEDGKRALIYPKEDADALAAAIIRIFADDALATRLSAGARSLRDLRPRRFGAEIAEVYQEIIKQKQ